MRKFSPLFAVLLLSVTLLPSVAQAQRPEPLTREDVDEIVKSSRLRPRLGHMIIGFGLAFDLSQEAETELRKAGVTDGQMKEIWQSFERRMVGLIRTLNTAQVTYAKTYDKGFSLNLAVLGPPPAGQKPSAWAADLIAPWLVGGNMGNSYTLTFTPGTPGADGRITSYTITARPAVWRPGLRSFYTDQSAVIRWTDENRAATASDRSI